MEFQEKFLADLDEKFKSEIALNGIFEGLNNKLIQFENTLKKFTSLGVLEVVYDYDDEDDEEFVKLSIDDDFLMFVIEWHETPPRIRVYADDVINEDNPNQIDLIYPFDNRMGSSVYWNVGLEKAFDHYLQKAFSNII